MYMYPTVTSFANVLAAHSIMQNGLGVFIEAGLAQARPELLPMSLRRKSEKHI